MSLVYDDEGRLRHHVAALLRATSNTGILRKDLPEITKRRSNHNLIRELKAQGLLDEVLVPQYGRRSCYALVATELADIVLANPDKAWRILERIPEPVDVLDQELPAPLLVATYQAVELEDMQRELDRREELRSLRRHDSTTPVPNYEDPRSDRARR